MSELFIGGIPDFFRTALVEQFVDSEVPFQFKVSPVIERIAQRVRNRPSPGKEFLVRLCIARAVAFRHAVGAHGAPLVVVALEPNLRKIAEAMIVGDLLRGEMAVIVENRLIRCVSAIKMASSLSS